jgi:hypothetical protein
LFLSLNSKSGLVNLLLFINILLLLFESDDEMDCIEDYFCIRDDEEVGEDEPDV